MPNKSLDNLYKSLGLLAIVLTILALFYTYTLYKESKLIGASAQNTITVSGEGKVTAKPDISTITVTLRETSKDAKGAEDMVSAKSDKFLKELYKIVDEKDVKTESYNSYPEYSYDRVVSSVSSNPKITGYTVTQSISVKVRDTANVSKVLDLVTSSGINEVNGPAYQVDDTSKYKEEARALAIRYAKEKAIKLADQLGVDIGRIVTFSENEGGFYPPIAYATMEKAGDMRNMAVSTPSLPVGENEIKSNVSITFEIK
jgi:uncharacterized protein YggE